MLTPTRARFPVAVLVAIALGLVACQEEPPTGPGGPDLYSKHGGGPKPLLVYVDPSTIPATFAIDGAAFSYTVIAENPSRDAQDVWMSLDVEQGPAGAPTAARFVDGFFLDCGAGEGVVPARSTCRMTRTGVVVSNGAVGHGTLVPGPATMYRRSYQGTGRKLTSLGEVMVGVTLTAP